MMKSEGWRRKWSQLLPPRCNATQYNAAIHFNPQLRWTQVCLAQEDKKQRDGNMGRRKHVTRCSTAGFSKAHHSTFEINKYYNFIAKLPSKMKKPRHFFDSINIFTLITLPIHSYTEAVNLYFALKAFLLFVSLTCFSFFIRWSPTVN